MGASNNLRRFLPGLIILFLAICITSASGQQMQVSASIDSNNVPQPGTITVPAGSTASGFQIINLTTGIPKNGIPLDHDSFSIYIFGIFNTTTVAYSYYKQKDQPPVQTPAPVTLATLVLGPGKYSVYVSGGPVSSLLLAYTLGGGGPGAAITPASGQQMQVSASIDSNTGPQPGTITVPAGSTAGGFQIINLTSGSPASGALDQDSFYIYIFGTTTAAYSYYKQKDQPPVQTPAPVTLATLVLGPGKYSVNVSGGPGANLLLAYTLGGGGPVAGGGPIQNDKSSMSSSYDRNCSGDVFKGGQWCGSQNGSDWLQLDFGSPRSVSEIRIKMAGTDVTTDGARIVLKLKTPNGEWVTVDEMQNTNINWTNLTGGATGNSIPSYRKVLATPVTAQAFRIEFTGNGWFNAQDIQVI